MNDFHKVLTKKQTVWLTLISLSVQFRSGPGFLSLSRCAACYNQKKSSTSWQGGDGESSSSAEDSGPELDSESEAESSSSSSSSGGALSEILEKPETEKPSSLSGDAAGPESGGKDADGREEMGETSESQEDKNKSKGVTLRAPLVKSFSLSSFTPNLIPLLPRSDTIVSTLNLQVLPQTHASDAFYIVKQHEEKTEEGAGGGGEGVNHLLPPQTGSQWQQWSQPTLQQHQLSYQYQQQPHQVLHQQQQPRHFSTLLAQCQRLPPPLHTPPMIHPPALHNPLQAPNASQTHLDALTPQPCWYCSSMHFPYSPYLNHYSSAHLPR